MSIEDQLKYVRKKLSLLSGDLPRIAIESGVPYHTVTKIGSGKIQDPGYSKVYDLFVYLKGREAKPKKSKRSSVE